MAMLNNLLLLWPLNMIMAFGIILLCLWTRIMAFDPKIWCWSHIIIMAMMSKSMAFWSSIMAVVLNKLVALAMMSNWSKLAGPLLLNRPNSCIRARNSCETIVYILVNRFPLESIVSGRELSITRNLASGITAISASGHSITCSCRWLVDNPITENILWKQDSNWNLCKIENICISCLKIM